MEKKFASRVADSLWTASLAVVALCFLYGSALAAAGNNPTSLSYSESLPEGDFTVIDVRPQTLCQQETLQGAICIAPEQVTTPAHRLANFSGILWLLGSAALDGSEKVVVIGQDALRKDFMAGVLHLAGQAEVQVMLPSVKTLLKSGKDSSKGRLRSNIRIKVFKSPMRSGQIILRNELLGLIRSGQSMTVLDGRSESEYWGHLMHGSRGGHLPGAVHSPYASWTLPPAEQPDNLYAHGVIAYAHDSRQSIAFYARLTAFGITARVLHEGWAGWAQDGQLPVDAASYPGQRKNVLTAAQDKGNEQLAVRGTRNQQTMLNMLLVMVLLIAGAVGGYWLRSRGESQND